MKEEKQHVTKDGIRFALDLVQQNQLVAWLLEYG